MEIPFLDKWQTLFIVMSPQLDPLAVAEQIPLNLAASWIRDTPTGIDSPIG
jgi:hypothetical protein